jgi:hypothetical protein
MAGGSKSKTKGNGAERELCKIWEGVFGGSFVRVPNSGAATGGLNSFRRQYLSETQNRIFRGDIIPPDFMPRLVLESKCYAEFPFHALLTPGGIPLLDSWIKQTLDAVEPGDLWFVCFKISRRGWFIAAPQTDGWGVGNYCEYTGVHGKFVVTDLATFLASNQDYIKEKSVSEKTATGLPAEATLADS